jgi:hypothetical protein
VRVILDECLPRRLGAKLIGHEVTTVAKAGWAGVTNGELLSRIEGRFDAFVTVDRNLPAQQRLASRSFGVVVIRALSNRTEDLLPLVAEILAALATVQPGQAVQVPARRP